jgi:predicted amidohydrolase
MTSIECYRRIVYPVSDFSLPMEPLRLAAVQATPEPGDLTANVRRAADSTARAVRGGARVVVFPELALCGYDLPALAACERLTVAADPSGTLSDPRLAPMVDAATSGAAVVLAGAAVRHPDGALTNSVLSFGSAGVRVVYDKQHLWHDDEPMLFRRGDRGATVTVDDWSFGLAICYDMSFPEHARAAALSGAHAYLCPSAFVAGREHRAAIYLAARALENTMYTVFVNPFGGPPDRPCAGGTTVYGADGTTTGTTTLGEAILLVDLDPAELRRVRGFLRMLAEMTAASRDEAGQPDEFTPHAAVSPGQVLGRQAQHQVLDLASDRWPPGTLARGVDSTHRI